MAVWHSNGYNRMTIIQFKSQLTVVMVHIYRKHPQNTGTHFMTDIIIERSIMYCLLEFPSRILSTNLWSVCVCVNEIFFVQLVFAYLRVMQHNISDCNRFQNTLKKWKNSVKMPLNALFSANDSKKFLIRFSYYCTRTLTHIHSHYKTNAIYVCKTRILADLFIFMIRL